MITQDLSTYLRNKQLLFDRDDRPTYVMGALWSHHRPVEIADLLKQPESPGVKRFVSIDDQEDEDE
jgi:hypothetical protein